MWTESGVLTIATGPLLPVPAVHGGAVHRMWAHLAPAFAAAGWHTTVAARAWPGQPADESVAGVHYRRHGGFAQSPSTAWNLLRDLPYAWELRRRLPPADLLVVNDFWLPRLSRPSQGRVVVSVNRRPKPGQGWIWRHAAALVAPTQVIASVLRESMPSLADRVQVIGNALPLAGFAGINPPRRPLALLYVGRLHPEKGVELAIRAVLGLRMAGLAVTLTIIGPAATDAGGAGEVYLGSLKALAGGDPAITFVGALYDPAALAAQYGSHDLMLYPSLAERGETFGVAPLEAMAAGCVPVVSALDCFGDFILDGQNGAVFDHRGADPVAALQQQVAALLAERVQLDGMRLAARATATRYDIAVIAQQWLQLFATLRAPASSASPRSPRPQ